MLPDRLRITCRVLRMLGLGSVQHVGFILSGLSVRSQGFSRIRVTSRGLGFRA